MKSEYIQYGCGLSHPEGWLNFDASPRLRIERIPLLRTALHKSGKALFPHGVRYGDIVRGLPLEQECARGVYCSHVLEHIDRKSVEAALRNTLKLLMPGGVFRLVVPDLAWRTKNYIEMLECGDSSANDWFMRASHLGQQHPMNSVMSRTRALLGNSQHRWMWDEASMARMLTDAGFISVRRCEFGDAEDTMFSVVEDQGRFFDSGRRELAMEARRDG